jgi:hypothetical protein
MADAADKTSNVFLTARQVTGYAASSMSFDGNIMNIIVRIFYKYFVYWMFNY